MKKFASWALLLAVLVASTAQAQLAPPRRGKPTSGPGAGTVTSVTAGTGLTGGTITGSGTISLTSPVATANGGNGVSSYPPFTKPNCSALNSDAVSGNNDIFIESAMAFAPFTLTSKGLTYKLGTADGAHLSDIGLYYCATPGSSTCALIEDIGAQDLSSNAYTTVAYQTNAGCSAAGAPGGLCTGSGTGSYPTLPVNEPPGFYIWAATSAATTATFTVCNGGGDTGWFAALTNVVGGVAGALPPTISSPAWTYTVSAGWLGAFQ